MAVDPHRPDLRVQSIDQSLVALELDVIEGKTFLGTTVYLDGRRWLNCNVQKCRVIISSGRFELIGNTFKDCNVEFVGAAQLILSVHLVMLGPQIEEMSRGDASR